MSYTRPPFDAADASFAGASSYTRPASDAADASFAPSTPSATLAATGPLGSAAIRASATPAAIARASGPLGSAAAVAAVSWRAHIRATSPIGRAALTASHSRSARIQLSGPLASSAAQLTAYVDKSVTTRLVARAALLLRDPIEADVIALASLLTRDRVETHLQAPSGHSITARLIAPAASALAISARLSAPAQSSQPMAAHLSAPVGAAQSVSAHLIAPAASALAISARLSAPAQSSQPIAAHLLAPVSVAQSVSAHLIAPAATALAISSRLSAPYAHTVTLAANLTASAALAARDPITVRLRAPAAMSTAEVVIVEGPNTLSVRGRVCALLDAEISAAADSPLWLADLALSDADDFAAIQIGDALELTFWGQTVSLICDGRELSRSPAGDTYTIKGVSPVAMLGSPWAAPVTLGTPGMAHATVERVLGLPLVWDLPDWALPVAAAALEDTPLDLARTIAAAAGGLIQSAPDGSLRAAPRDPVGVPARASADVAALLTDADLLGMRDAVSAANRTNRFTITSGDTDSTIDAEIKVEVTVDPDDPYAYDVRAYPTPWRALELAHTGDAATEIGQRTDAETTHSELVEVIAGSATAAYPITTLSVSRYQYADLGAVSHEAATLTTATEAESLLAIDYRARCWHWRVTNARDETIQFLIWEE